MKRSIRLKRYEKKNAKIHDSDIPESEFSFNSKLVKAFKKPNADGIVPLLTVHMYK